MAKKRRIKLSVKKLIESRNGNVDPTLASMVAQIERLKARLAKDRAEAASEGGWEHEKFVEWGKLGWLLRSKVANEEDRRRYKQMAETLGTAAAIRAVNKEQGE